jgi:hypothetical protein
MPLLTLFTAPKAFTHPHIRIIQRNMLLNWQALGAEVEVLVIGDDAGIAQQCQELGIRHLSGVHCNERGTPLVSSIFELARQNSVSPVLAYANADILFLPDLLDAVRRLVNEKDRFLAIGQRWDVDITDPIAFSNGWDQDLTALIRQAGELHGQTGSDYFLFPRACFKQIPDFAIGRAGWDNWMIYQARAAGWPVIDASEAITVLHQNHDFSHLPGGKKHFFQPETDVNVRLGGGRRTIFTMKDSTHFLTADGLRQKRCDWTTFWREVEIFPLVQLNSRPLGWLSFAAFHPVKAFNEVRGWLAYKLQSR